MIAPQSAQLQLRSMKIFEAAALVFWSLSIMFFLARLGSMNLDGVPTIGISSIALGIGYTSLLYSRARAIEDGPNRRRCLIAAESSMRGVIFHLITLFVGTLIFAYLCTKGYSPRNIEWEGKGALFGAEPIPLASAFFVALLAQFAATQYFFSLRTLLRRGCFGDALPSAFSRHRRFYSSLARRPPVTNKRSAK